ncbi:MAG: hypothetical protein JNM52_00655, partial [Betaproteobacteria bacterium]|nr:hypothetical protein [Betaproteobacteria bacterium]
MLVRDFHHTLLWPVQLRPLRRRGGDDALYFWDLLKQNGGPWRYVDDPLLINDATCLAGYEEFIYFLPYVQRFLYGVGDEGRGAQASLHIFRREDIKQVSIKLTPDREPLLLAAPRARLYFFYDIDIAIVVFEIAGQDIPLADCIEIVDRFGRSYPSAWDAGMQGAHCLHEVTFLSESGQVLATSDYENRQKYLDLVRDQRQTPLASHWEYLMHPLVPAYKSGTIQFYQIENKRIPIMSYFAFDDPHQLSRGDMARIGFAAKWGASETLPYAENFLRNFEWENCYDRYWQSGESSGGMDTRYFFCGASFSMITKAGGRDSLIREFRHQFFQIGLIANFHKAALLSLSNRFSRAVERLNVRDFESVKRFKRHVRETLEVFLRFNHRYWFHEISNQVQASDFFQRWSHQLGSDALFSEVREEARDINEYLDADRARKQTDNAM